jgi:hypothetical protein
MIGTLTLAGAIVVGSVIMFAVSIRVGILLGRRLDGVLEARMSEDSEGPSSVDAGASTAPGDFGQEENRGD